LDLGIRKTGISLGNSREWRGLRLHLLDAHVERIDGVNLIFASFTTNLSARYRGLHVTVLGANLRSISGVGLSPGGAEAVGHLSGVNIGGLAEVVNAEKNLDRGRIRGLTLASLCVLSTGTMSGISGALGLVAAEGPLSGVAVAGLAGGSDSTVTGVIVTGIWSEAKGLYGAGLSGVGVHATDLRGLGVAPYVQANRATGVMIAILIRADELNGVELGVLNYAGNNRGWRRWLPVLNAHF
jgi:hypothetical protein